MNTPTLTVIRHGHFAPLKATWDHLLAHCPSNTIFLTWEWQELWWRWCGEGDLHLLTIQADDEVVGIAPLQLVHGAWGFAGGVEVADFLDVIARPPYASDVARAVLDYLQAHGGAVDLRNLRPTSLGATLLYAEAQARGIRTEMITEDVSPRIELPADWDTYLQSLTKKDRHELRRKMRRLMGAGDVRYRAVSDPATYSQDVGDFLRLHRLSAEAKAAFMTPEMERYFRALVDQFGPAGLLRLYFLEIDGVRVASLILFDYGNEFLLYNSGYDPAYAPLSVGLLLKAYCIRDAIGEGKRAYDFLQGNEPYKYDLGGVDVPIFQLRLGLTASEETHAV